jgi:prepilin-type N-terminal cleavage/methylation domain-containing protein
MRLPSKQDENGFTLVELVIVLVALAILSAYAVVKSTSAGEVTLPSQAQTLASDIRHAQTLAYTLGNRMRFTSASTSYGYSACTCGTSCTDFVVSLQKQAQLAVSPASSNPLYFNSLGQPLDNTCNTLTSTTKYTLTSGSAVTVSVKALTGIVNVCPPSPASMCL